MHCLRSLFVALSVVGCASSANQPAEDPEASGSSKRRSSGEGLSMEAEVGALNEARVNEAFGRANDGLVACMTKSKLPAVSGVARVVIHVDTSGSVVKSFLKKSTLGDRSTEDCMLGVLRAQSWPGAIGGKVGIAENQFDFDAPSGVRPPVAWSEADAGKNLGAAKAVLGECQAAAKAGPLTATVIVETDGSIASVGVAGEDESSEKAARCVQDGLASIKLNSPGSFAAKLTFSR